MDFGSAIAALKEGNKISRAGWNGKGMFVYLNEGSAPAARLMGDDFIGGVPAGLFTPGAKGTTVRMPNLNMRAADGYTVTGWLASQTDILAEDWGIVE